MPFKHATKLEKDYFISITPRNLQALKVKEGDQFSYEILTLDGKPIIIKDFRTYVNGEKIKMKFKNKGVVVADNHNLLLIPYVPIDKNGCVVSIKRK